MAIRNDHGDYGRAFPRKPLAGQDEKHGLHDYDEPTPDFKDTMLELVMTVAGIVGVFFLIIALVKVFA